MYEVYDIFLVVVDPGTGGWDVVPFAVKHVRQAGQEIVTFFVIRICLMGADAWQEVGAHTPKGRLGSHFIDLMITEIYTVWLLDRPCHEVEHVGIVSLILYQI